MITDPEILLKCAQREVAMRQRVYPKRVASGKMTQEKADSEVEAMEEIARRLEINTYALGGQLKLSHDQIRVIGARIAGSFTQDIIEREGFNEVWRNIEDQMALMEFWKKLVTDLLMEAFADRKEQTELELVEDFPPDATQVSEDVSNHSSPGDEDPPGVFDDPPDVSDEGEDAEFEFPDFE